MGQHDTMMAVLDMQCITGLLTGRGPWILQSMVGTRYIRAYYEGLYVYGYISIQRNKFISIPRVCCVKSKTYSDLLYSMATRVQFGRTCHPSHLVHFEPEPSGDLQRERGGRGERVIIRSGI